MRRTMIIGAISATALTIGLGVGASLATADPIVTIPSDMTSMMDNGMNGMMDANGMSAMHDELDGSVPAEVLASCDATHASMTDRSTPSLTDAGPGHSAHHPGVRP